MPSLDTIKLAIVGILLAWATIATWGWRHEVNAYATFRAETKAAGDMQAAKAKQEDERHERNLQQVAKAYSDAIPTAQDEAVRRYRATHPIGVCQSSPGSGAMSQAGSGVGGNDEAGSKQGADTGHVAPDGAAGGDSVDVATLRACGEDAVRVEAWRIWATKQGLPVQ